MVEPGTRADPVALYVVDPDPAVRARLTWLLGGLALPVHVFPDAECLLGRIAAAASGCLIADVDLPGMGGVELKAELDDRGIRLTTVLIAQNIDVETAVAAMRCGAFDLIEKPLVDRVVLARVREALCPQIR